MPCPILDSAGGIWKFDAEKNNQSYGDGKRFATGLRNVVGLDWNKQNNQLFVMQHGRDQLHDLFPDLYDDKASAEKPAETMYALKEGSNAGWPYIYFDPELKQKIVAPEYGGDGKKFLLILHFKIRPLHSRHIWLPMPCCFIQVTSFLPSTRMVLL